MNLFYLFYMKNMKIQPDMIYLSDKNFIFLLLMTFDYPKWSAMHFTNSKNCPFSVSLVSLDVLCRWNTFICVVFNSWSHLLSGVLHSTHPASKTHYYSIIDILNPYWIIMRKTFVFSPKDSALLCICSTFFPWNNPQK